MSPNDISLRIILVNLWLEAPAFLAGTFQPKAHHRFPRNEPIVGLCHLALEGDGTFSGPRTEPVWGW